MTGDGDRPLPRTEPEDVFRKHASVFASDWCDASFDDWDKDDEEDDDSGQSDHVHSVRMQAVREVFIQAGYHGILEFALVANAEREVGWYAAQVLEAEDMRQDFARTILRTADSLESERHQSLMQGFLHGAGGPPAIRLVEAMWPEHGDATSIALLFLCRFDRLAWSLAEKMGGSLVDKYWTKVQPSWIEPSSDEDLNHAISQLLNAGRSPPTLHYPPMFWARVQSTHLHRILSELPNSDEADELAADSTQLHVQRAFNELSKRGALSQAEITRIKLLYIDRFWLEGGGTPNLEEEFEANPDRFCHVLALLYRPENDDATRAPSDAELKRAEAAYRLLHKLAHIPGYRIDGNTKASTLSSWIGKVRALCRANNRQRAGDQHIGRLLAKAPEGEDCVWPCQPVRDVLEGLLNADIEEGFVQGRLRTWSGKLCGGTFAQAEDKAYICGVWAKACEDSTPKVARVLRRLTSGYESGARLGNPDAAVQKRLDY